MINSTKELHKQSQRITLQIPNNLFPKLSPNAWVEPIPKKTYKYNDNDPTKTLRDIQEPLDTYNEHVCVQCVHNNNEKVCTKVEQNTTKISLFIHCLAVQ